MTPVAPPRPSLLEKPEAAPTPCCTARDQNTLRRAML